jgi:hypothetical protein
MVRKTLTPLDKELKTLTPGSMVAIFTIQKDGTVRLSCHRNKYPVSAFETAITLLEQNLSEDQKKIEE